MENTTSIERLSRLAADFNIDLDDEMVPAGRYSPVARAGNLIWLSGQIPKIAGEVVVQGTIGIDVTVDEGKRAARICTLRALALLSRAACGLDNVSAVVKLTVFMQSASTFRDLSAVADAASETIEVVLQERGVHARTSLGGMHLPKNAAVEIDLTASCCV